MQHNPSVKAEICLTEIETVSVESVSRFVLSGLRKKPVKKNQVCLM